MFIGNKETQKAAAQQVIEAGVHLSKAASALRILQTAVTEPRREFVAKLRHSVLESEDLLSEAFSDACRAAFIEE